MYSDGSRDVFAESEETKSVQNKLLPADKVPPPKPKPTGVAAAPAPAGPPQQQPVAPAPGSEAGPTAP
jgi:hypothetical protein